MKKDGGEAERGGNKKGSNTEKKQMSSGSNGVIDCKQWKLTLAN